MKHTFLYFTIHMFFLQIQVSSNSCHACDEVKLTSVKHQLPQNCEEIGLAIKAHLVSRKMLDEIRVFDAQKIEKAIECIRTADKFYVPDILSVMWDVGRGKYTLVPQNVQQEFLQRLPNFEIYEQLFKDYQLRFGKNHSDIMDRNNKSRLGEALRNFRYESLNIVKNIFFRQDEYYQDNLSHQQSDLELPLLDSLKKNL